jgi:hypothetical protein
MEITTSEDGKRYIIGAEAQKKEKGGGEWGVGLYFIILHIAREGSAGVGMKSPC